MVYEQHSHICAPLVQVGEGERAVRRARVMASSVDLLGLHVNCSGSNESGKEGVRKDLTIRSKHFMIVEVSAPGW